MTKTLLTIFTATILILILGNVTATYAKDINKGFMEGMRLLSKGDLKTARQVLGPILKKDPRFIQKIYDKHNKRPERERFIALLKPLASEDTPDIAFYLASMLDRTPDEKNPGEYMRYLKMAHNAGDLYATKNLGSDYYAGRVSKFDFHKPKRDFIKAAEYFRRCAKTLVRCKEGLGLTLLQFKDKKEEAIKFLNEAKSFISLWALYQFGSNGVTKNQQKANKLSIKISQQLKKNKTDIVLQMGAGRVFKKYDLFKKGDGDAIRRFAFEFDNSNSFGFPHDKKLYLKLLKEAVKAKDAGAAETLGRFYLEGKNVRKDYVFAYAMYNLVLEWGSGYEVKRAKAELNILEDSLSKTDLSEAQRLTRKLSADF